MAVQTYSLRDVVLVIGGVIIDGYSDGDAISVEFPESWTVQKGAGGAVTRSRVHDRTAQLTVRLQQTAVAQLGLAAQAALDRATGGVTVPVVLRDLLGTDLFASPQAWIAQRPSMTFGGDSGVREWRYTCADVVDSTGA